MRGGQPVAGGPHREETGREYSADQPVSAAPVLRIAGPRRLAEGGTASVPESHRSNHTGSPIVKPPGGQPSGRRHGLRWPDDRGTPAGPWIGCDRRSRPLLMLACVSIQSRTPTHVKVGPGRFSGHFRVYSPWSGPNSGHRPRRTNSPVGTCMPAGPPETLAWWEIGLGRGQLRGVKTCRSGSRMGGADPRNLAGGASSVGRRTGRSGAEGGDGPCPIGPEGSGAPPSRRGILSLRRAPRLPLHGSALGTRPCRFAWNVGALSAVASGARGTWPKRAVARPPDHRPPPARSRGAETRPRPSARALRREPGRDSPGRPGSPTGAVETPRSSRRLPRHHEGVP